MKKEFRIKKNEEFSRIIGQRHSYASANFVIYYSDKRENNVRVGISVSKKLGNAVQRNKIKRQIREMVYSIIDFDNDNKDIVIIARTSYLKNTYQDNLSDLEKLIKKAII